MKQEENMQCTSNIFTVSQKDVFLTKNTAKLNT